MASSSSSLTTPTNSLLTHPVTEKLTKSNHALWHAQVRPAIRGAKLLGFLTGETKAPPATLPKKGTDGKDLKDAHGKIIEEPNPSFDDWDATDQQVLSYLLVSLSKDVLLQVSSCTTAAEAWAEIQGTYASRTRARAVNTRLALGTTRKGNLSIAEYFGKMKALGDDMAAAGRPLEDEELVRVYYHRP
jgi:hypothetical protein